ncbi:UNVERIFIED_CONTAM: hypothetical protein GTU68_054179 [Idotea baltica]|nr:hypothetical protein [Idotea baltica]
MGRAGSQFGEEHSKTSFVLKSIGSIGHTFSQWQIGAQIQMDPSTFSPLLPVPGLITNIQCLVESPKGLRL